MCAKVGSLTAFLLITLTTTAAQCMNLLIMPLRNLSGTNDNHWQNTVASLIGSQLREVDDIRIMADGFLDFAPDDSLAWVYSHIQGTQRTDLELTRAIGRAMQADRVIWGSYERKGTNWDLWLQILDVSASQSSLHDSPVLTGEGREWMDLVRSIRPLVLSQLAVQPTPDVISRMESYLPKSGAALELMSQALRGRAIGEPVSMVEAKLRMARSLDPDFQPVLQALAQAILYGGEIDEAIRIAKQSVEACPWSARAHYTLASAFLVEGLKTLARDEFLSAERLEPDQPRILMKLGQIARLSGQWDQAIRFFARAAALEPWMAITHAELARANLARGEASRALEEVRLAERYNPGNDLQLTFILGQLYPRLHRVPKAVTNLERFISGAEQTEPRLPDVEIARSALADLKPLLTAHFVTASKPRSIGPAQLKSVLESKLGSTDCAFVRAPFESSPEMQAFARHLVANATNDLMRAESLFDWMMRCIPAGTNNSEQTAMEAFRTCCGDTGRLSCQDYTFLFVALARSVGLDAYYVVVNRDCYGKAVPHTCGGIFLKNKALLVDPTYLWFGAPHKDYQFEDDLRAQALFMAQSRDQKVQGLAVKLAPDFAMPYFIRALDLAASGELKVARDNIREGLALNATNWLAYFAQGVCEAHAGHASAAIGHFQQCKSFSVNYPPVYYYLASALASAGRLEEAREELQTYLRSNPDAEGVASLTWLLASLDSPTRTYRSNSSFPSLAKEPGALFPHPADLFSGGGSPRSASIP